MAEPIKQQEYQNIDNYGIINQLIQEWVAKFMSDKESIHVAISRKAPRLLEWGMMSEVGNDLTVVTELALPFIDWKKENKCLVVDEAIYHGTTFEKILSLLDFVNPNWKDLAAMPLVVTTEALGSDDITSHLTRGLKIISPEEIPFFVDTIISKFFELGKPYDIEYPLFYVDFKKEITDSDVMSFLDRLAENQSQQYGIDKSKIDYFKVENYCREQDRTYYTYTYCTDYLYDKGFYGMAKPDFSKLRFFVRGNRLCVASMSPYTIPDQYIERRCKAFTGKFLEVWVKLFEKAYGDGHGIRGASQNAEYLYQWRKSMVMTINYLLSFQHFLKLKEAMLFVMGNDIDSRGFYQDPKDIQYLFGKEMTPCILQMLSGITSCEPNQAFLSLGKTVKSIIPSDYQKSYKFQMAADNFRKGQTENISLMLSSMFSSMHWLVEVQSRLMQRQDYSRLRFGESYASIQDRFQLVTNFSDTELLHGIHRGIDQRIDRGSIVPNYVKVKEGVAESWVRLFRSGENEDVFKDQLLRIMLTIVKSNFHFTGRQFMTRESLEYILSIFYFLEKEDKKLLQVPHVELHQKLFGLPWVPSFSVKSFMYEMKVRLGDKNVGLVAYAIDNDILKVDEFGYIVISSSSYVEKLIGGVPLDNEMQININKVVAFVENKVQLGTSVLTELNPLYEWDSSMLLSSFRQEVKKDILQVLCSDNFDLPSVKEATAAALTLVLRTVELSEEQYDESVTYYAVMQVWEQLAYQANIDEAISPILWKGLTRYLRREGKRFEDEKSCYNWLCQLGGFQQLMNLPKEELKGKLAEIVK